jgi:hypothetical protein
MGRRALPGRIGVNVFYDPIKIQKDSDPKNTILYK